MKFKLQHTNIELTTKANLNNEIHVAFAFNETILPIGAKFLGKTSISKYDDLSEIGSISLTGVDKKFLILSLGSKENYTLANYIKAIKSLANFISKNKKINKIDIILEEQIAKLLHLDIHNYIEQTMLHLLNGMYYFDEYKSVKKSLAIEHINFVTKIDAQKSLENVLYLLEGLFLLKNLANSPANIATPTFLAKTAQSFSKLSNKVKIDILDKKEIKKLNMNTFLAVAAGSNEEPKFIKMEYHGAKTKQKPIVLVGKGITFDSGGISLKPSANMDEMKFDMCGAATVMAAFLVTVKLGLAINLVAVIPTCENLPSGHAVKPGDIIKTMSGQTVEIANTDAEGRLILCDALTYVEKYDPELVIDVATLTGAIVVALGNVASGLYSNDEKLATALIASANRTNDKVWQMPLFEEYVDQLKANTADLSNIGGWSGKGGSATAAGFLSKFVNYKWAHLDVAGTAWSGAFSGSDIAGATGRPFYMLMDFIRNYSK